MTADAVRLIAAGAAVCAALALVMARFGFPRAADALVLTAAIIGVVAFVSVAVWTVRRARHLPPGPKAP